MSGAPRIESRIGRGLSAIMFTDIVGYTAIVQTNEEKALKILEHHNELLSSLFPKYYGREVKRIGDSFLVEFSSALEAVRCAVDIQKLIHNENSLTADEEKFRLRIGIHLGDVIRKDGDIFGDAVNIASRIEPIANPGGICISQQVFDQVHNKLDYPLQKLEKAELKNVSFETNVYSVSLPWIEKGREEFTDESDSTSMLSPLQLKSDTAIKVFDSLVDSFIEDYMVKKYLADKSGWRTLGEIAQKARLSPSLLYGKHSTMSPVLDEPLRRGLIESRYFPGERGRGGEVMRLRIAFDKEPIRQFVNKKVMAGKNFSSQQYAQTMQDVGIPIKSNSQFALATETPERTLDKKRIAVLPFTNLSPDPKDAYFADGMTEELISKISLIPELGVISRTSVMTYKNQPAKRASDIARELRVGTLLEGSVRKAGNRVRISAQLIDAANEVHLWAEIYDRSLEDVFSIQSEVASNVASSLKLKLLSKERAKIGKETTSSVDAYTLYLKACFQFNGHNKESYLAAIRLFEQAVQIDSQFALAYARLSDCYALLGFQALSADKNVYSKAEEYAKTALRIDEMLPEAHMALGFVLFDKWDLSGAEREFLRAIEINPNFASAHIFYAQLLTFSRRYDESIIETRKALELDPLSAETSQWAGTAYLYAGLYDESIKQFNNALEADANMIMARNNLGLAHIRQGMISEGLSIIQKAVELAGENGFIQFANDLGYAYMVAEKPEETKKILTHLLKIYEEKAEPVQLTIPISGLYASLGEKEKALDWLERAYDEHHPFLLAMNCDMIYDPIREEPRFISLTKKIGF